MKKVSVFIGLIVANVTVSAFASPVDNSSALTSAQAVARVSPSDGGAYAELAGAYVQAGRMADALTAYRRVLALDNVMLETSSGDAIWSHEVARKAIARTAILTSR